MSARGFANRGGSDARDSAEAFRVESDAAVLCVRCGAEAIAAGREAEPLTADDLSDLGWDRGEYRHDREPIDCDHCGERICS